MGRELPTAAMQRKRSAAYGLTTSALGRLRVFAECERGIGVRRFPSRQWPSTENWSPANSPPEEAITAPVCRVRMRLFCDRSWRTTSRFDLELPFHDAFPMSVVARLPLRQLHKPRLVPSRFLWDCKGSAGSCVAGKRVVAAAKVDRLAASPPASGGPVACSDESFAVVRTDWTLMVQPRNPRHQDTRCDENIAIKAGKCVREHIPEACPNPSRRGRRRQADR